eukprot:gene25016-30512_t
MCTSPDVQIVMIASAIVLGISAAYAIFKEVKRHADNCGLSVPSMLKVKKNVDGLVNAGIFGAAESAVFYAAFETGVWRAIQNNPMTLEELAANTKATLTGSRCICEYLWARGTIKRGSDRKYYHSYGDDITAFLEPKVYFFHEIAHRQLFYLAESCMTDQPVGLQTVNGVEDIYKARVNNPSLEKWQRMMDTHSETIIKNVVRSGLIPYTKYKKVLDVCGNQGANALYIHSYYPHLEIVIHDLPSVLPVASKRITAGGLSEKISVYGKDLDELDIHTSPKGFDLIQMLHCSSEWPLADLTSRCKILRESLAAEGELVMLTASTFDTDGKERKKYRNAILRMPYFMACTKSNAGMHSFEGYSKALYAAGFSKVVYK